MNNASDFDATITHCPICGKATHVRPGAYGRRFSWAVPDLNADQYEILCTINQETANV